MASLVFYTVPIFLLALVLELWRLRGDDRFVGYEPRDTWTSLALGVAKPGAGLTAPAGFTLTVEVDGQPLGTGESVALVPSEEKGTLTT